MVYYRQYRPQAIEDLDNTKVREVLQSIFKGKTPPHAFLFTGPKGLGKTSAARIVAKVINCTENPEKRKNGFEPCNKCEMCKSITEGTNLDVLEIDGASNRGIDEIRSLRERVNLAPSNSQTKRKVYIIDEVHMLTTEAFNALLKTIEEPPLHVMFIFCTTEPHKVPETILSRCFHITFSLATDEEIVHSLKRIAKGEKIDVDEKALFDIAKISEGGFRDASKIFEELVSLSDGKKITPEIVEKKYQLSGISNFVTGLLESLSGKDTKKSLQLIKQITEQGIDLKYFLQNMLEALHSLVLVKLNVLSDSKYTQISKNFTIDDIRMLVHLFSEAYSQSKYTPIVQLPLEIAVVSWGQLDSVEDQAEDPAPDVKIDNKNTVDSMLKKHHAMRIKNLLTKKEDKKDEKEKIQENQPKQGNLKAENGDLSSLLENLIYKVKPYNHSVAGVLRGSKIKTFSEDEITFVTPYKFHKERLEERKSCEIIEKALKEITGKQPKISVQLKQ